MMTAQKVVLVTGANKGIGYETAKQLAKLGHFVFLGCRDKQNGQKAIAAFKKDGCTNVEMVELDVTKSATIQSVADCIKSKFGRLDILVNNEDDFRRNAYSRHQTTAYKI